jgi:hypothetical protein
MRELVFVMSSRQNRFFTELVEAVRFELDRLSVATSVSFEGFPDPAGDEVGYVLLPPHEYLHLEGPARWPEARIARRTIFVCAEQPGTSFFEDNVRLGPQGGALFDINRSAVREYGRRGLRARHLKLGYSRFWDHMGEARARDVDVLFMGCHTGRRASYLSGYATSLWRWQTKLVLSDNSRPNTEPSTNFLVGTEKWRVLGRTKVLLNLHQGAAQYFEWLRVAEAICNGCVVVSEHSSDYEPLEPSTHFVSGRPETLGLLAQELVEDEQCRLGMAESAYDFLRRELPLRAAAEELANVAEDLTKPRGATRGAEGRELTPTVVEPAPAASNAQLIAQDPPDSDSATLRQAIKELALELRELRRDLERTRRETADGSLPEIVRDRETTAYAPAHPCVSVLTTLYNYGSRIGAALDSVAGQDFRDFEVVVLDDGSSDDSVERVHEWITCHDHVPIVLFTHPLNQGLPHARNAALSQARGELVFILDADNELYPGCLRRLVAALSGDPGAAFAYGILERVSHDGPVGLSSCFPWNPGRLKTGNYIDAMALIRTRILRDLGGYTTDGRLHGWEDYDLWCRMAEQGLRATFVPEIVARYRVAPHSMLALTNLSTTVAFSVLAERYPNVMGGAPRRPFAAS